MRNSTTLDPKPVEFDRFRVQAGSNVFTTSPKKRGDATKRNWNLLQRWEKR